MDDLHNVPFQYHVPNLPPADAVKVTANGLEKLLLDHLAAAKDDPFQARYQLALFYRDERRTDQAMEQFRLLLEIAPNLEAKAQIVLGMGQTAERSGDFDLAVNCYRQALLLEPTDKDIWFFINNNLGFSLIQLGAFDEAEQYCRAAIKINPGRSNGHKNLGIALQGQGRYREAAQAFIAATQVDASDPRSLGHLEELLTEHPKLAADFERQLELCKKAVAVAAEEMFKAEAAWLAAREKPE